MKTNFRFAPRFSSAPTIVWSLVAASALASPLTQKLRAQDSNTASNAGTSSSATSSTATSSTRSEAESNANATTEAATAESTATAESAAIDTEANEVVSEPIFAEPAPSVETPLPANPKAGSLVAEVVKYEGNVLVAENTSDKPVVFQTADARIEARRLRLDAVNRTLRAEGDVYVERQRRVTRQPLLASSTKKRGVFPTQEETVTETLRGQDFRYDFKTQTGSIDKAKLSLSGFSVSTDELIVNGRIYTAKNVVLRPGAPTEAERKLYGTPPFNIRANAVTVDSSGSQKVTSAEGGTNSSVQNGANVSNPTNGASNRQPRIGVTGGALYYKNTKLLPVPSYFLNSVNRGPRDPQAFSLTPRISFSAVDRVLVTSQFRYGLSKNPNGLALNADVGLSARIGLRGGVSLEAPTRLGTFGLGLRKSDIVTSQLTNRIELDRTPELTFASPFIPVLRLPGKRVAGLSVSGGVGNFRERLLGDNASQVSKNRSEVALNFTTRGVNVPGPYLDVFARVASYGNQAQKYRNAGFEIGYAGKLIPRVNGVLSYRATSLKGETPFRFDRVEIARELRGTVDLEVTPRYLVPIDLRYDLDSKTFRDRTIGVLRNYKTFAYGVVYQSARNELRAEIRQGF